MSSSLIRYTWIFKKREIRDNTDTCAHQDVVTSPLWKKTVSTGA